MPKSTDTEEAWITSNGYGVSVARRPTTFSLWQKDHFSTQAGNPVIAGPTADPDADNLVNLLEYALATDPASSSSGPHSTLTVEATPRLALGFDRVADPALLYEVQARTDLANWGPTPLWSSTGAANLPGPITVADSVALNTAPRRFLRLVVTQP